jgi:hypothetical protein
MTPTDEFTAIVKLADSARLENSFVMKRRREVMKRFEYKVLVFGFRPLVFGLGALRLKTVILIR